MKEVKEYNDLPNNYWHFIGKHLPGYSSNNNVLRSDILSRFILDEEVKEEDYDWLPKTKEEAQMMLEEIDLELYNEAVRAYNRK